MLFYADDTVVFRTDENDFQNNLDMFFECSELLHLNIKFKKLKVLDKPIL